LLIVSVLAACGRSKPKTPKNDTEWHDLGVSLMHSLVRAVADEVVENNATRGQCEPFARGLNRWIDDNIEGIRLIDKHEAAMTDEQKERWQASMAGEAAAMNAKLKPLAASCRNDKASRQAIERLSAETH
jgi:hypothetical protein